MTGSLVTGALIASFPALSVYVSNQAELESSVLWVPLLASGGLGGLAAFLIGVLFRNAASGLVMAGLGVLLFFTYSPLYEGLEWAQNFCERSFSFRGFSRTCAAMLLVMVGVLLWSRKRSAFWGRRRERLIYRVILTGMIILLGTLLLVVAYRFGAVAPVTRWSALPRVVFWGLLALAVLVEIGRRRGTHRPLADFFRRAAGPLILIPVVAGVGPYVTQGLVSSGKASTNEVRKRTAKENPVESRARPDIIHIVLDAHERPDILEAYYGIDGKAFLRPYEERGFSVAEKATANYLFTRYSFAATFNFEYLHRFEEAFGIDEEDRSAVAVQRERNRVMKFLRDHGYGIYGFESGFSVSKMDYIDRYLGEGGHERQRFLATLLDLTPVPTARAMLFGSESPEYTRHRNRLYATLKALPGIASLPSPKFVLVHMVAPHAPFVLGSRGEPFVRPGHRPMLVKPETPEERAEAKAHYRDQVLGINRLLFEALDKLIPKLERPTIILIQGDHFGGIALHGNAPAVLNAIRFPGKRPADFTDDATLVNTYRIVFNEYFGTDYELLESACFRVHSDAGKLQYERIEGGADPDS